MFEYFTVNQLFTELIFPLIYSLTPVIITYIILEPISHKLTNLLCDEKNIHIDNKKNIKSLTNSIT